MSPGFWTGPNLLTLSRLPMAALVWLWPTSPAWVLGLLALAGVTDVLDGAWERRRRAGREGPPGVGVWLDPLCDKIFLISALSAVVTALGRPLFLIPVIAAREILQTAAALASRCVPALRRRLRFRFKAAAIGKATTVLQFLALGALLAGSPWTLPIAVVTGALGAIAATVYVAKAVRPPGD